MSQQLNPWSQIFANLDLNRAERAVVKRFEQDLDGRGFLPVADILRAHNRISESIELLTQGVERHPSFTVARVVLARELYSRGLIAQSWFTLEATTHSLSENVLAQKLRFRLAILIGLESEAHEIATHLQMQSMHDDETRKLHDALRTGTVLKAKDMLLGDFRAVKIEPVIPSLPEILGETPAESAPVENTEAPANELEDDQEETDVDDKLSHFHVVPLDEVFRGVSINEDGETNSGLELDSTTLADLYVKQAHYSKAIAIYRRLLRMTPNSDYLKNKVRELVQLEKAQRNDDLAIDPTVVDQMEALSIIDEQIKFYTHLEEVLEGRQR